MVNNLLCVKPNVPVATDLKKWHLKHDSMRNSLGQVRYGSHKPLKGISVRLCDGLNSRRSSVSSVRSSQQKVTLQLVNERSSRQKLQSAVYRSNPVKTISSYKSTRALARKRITNTFEINSSHQQVEQPQRPTTVPNKRQRQVIDRHSLQTANQRPKGNQAINFATNQVLPPLPPKNISQTNIFDEQIYDEYLSHKSRVSVSDHELG